MKDKSQNDLPSNGLCGLINRNFKTQPLFLAFREKYQNLSCLGRPGSASSARKTALNMRNCADDVSAHWFRDLDKPAESWDSAYMFPEIAHANRVQLIQKYQHDPQALKALNNLMMQDAVDRAAAALSAAWNELMHAINGNIDNKAFKRSDQKRRTKKNKIARVAGGRPKPSEGDSKAPIGPHQMASELIAQTLSDIKRDISRPVANHFSVALCQPYCVAIGPDNYCHICKKYDAVYAGAPGEGTARSERSFSADFSQFDDLFGGPNLPSQVEQCDSGVSNMSNTLRQKALEQKRKSVPHNGNEPTSPLQMVRDSLEFVTSGQSQFLRVTPYRPYFPPTNHDRRLVCSSFNDYDEVEASAPTPHLEETSGSGSKSINSMTTSIEKPTPVDAKSPAKPTTVAGSKIKPGTPGPPGDIPANVTLADFDLGEQVKFSEKRPRVLGMDLSGLWELFGYSFDEISFGERGVKIRDLTMSKTTVSNLDEDRRGIDDALIDSRIHHEYAAFLYLHKKTAANYSRMGVFDYELALVHMQQLGSKWRSLCEINDTKVPYALAQQLTYTEAFVASELTKDFFAGKSVNYQPKHSFFMAYLTKRRFVQVSSAIVLVVLLLRLKQFASKGRSLQIMLNGNALTSTIPTALPLVNQKLTYAFFSFQH